MKRKHAAGPSAVVASIAIEEARRGERAGLRCAALLGSRSVDVQSSGNPLARRIHSHNHAGFTYGQGRPPAPPRPAPSVNG